MKSDKLKLYIRQIVREEVATAIGEVITEMKQPTVNEHTTPAKNKRKQPAVKKIYSSNSVLNDILNETAETSIFNGSGDNPLTEIHNTMKSSYGIPSKTTVNIEEATAMGISPDKLNNVNTDFITRDYSEVLKKSYEKSGKR
jgi:hypothetical protein